MEKIDRNNTEEATTINLSDTETLRNYLSTEILTTKEAAELLHTTRQCLITAVETGKIKPLRKSPAVWLFLKADLKEFACSNTRVRNKIEKYIDETIIQQVK